ncbi:MAG TPA: alpha/beta fold hydrolase [Gemmatimonadaceae bacterium]|nr:alpha/beta fold hydrolase [Gemmatimonadaceae bacterium]
MSEREWPDRESWRWPPMWVRVEGGRIHYVRAGSGPPVVFVHGTPTWSYEWRHALQAMSASHEVIALDHLGFGRSDRPEGADYSPQAHAARFREAMEVLLPEGRVSLVVHDFGGPIALDWALDHPERLSRLVVVNSWMWSFADDPTMKGQARMAGSWILRLLYRHANASLRLIMPAAYADRSRLTRAIHEQYLAPFPDPDSRERVLFALAKSLAGSSAFFAGLWERRHRLAGVPVDILWGMRDRAFKPAMLARWEEAVPHARIHRIERAGHWPHEEVPDEFNGALVALMDPAC